VSDQIFVTEHCGLFYVVFNDGERQRLNGPYDTEEEARKVLRDIAAGPSVEASIIQ